MECRRQHRDARHETLLPDGERSRAGCPESYRRQICRAGTHCAKLFKYTVERFAYLFRSGTACCGCSEFHGWTIQAGLQTLLSYKFKLEETIAGSADFFSSSYVLNTVITGGLTVNPSSSQRFTTRS
jgi:hypothetical protein